MFAAIGAGIATMVVAASAQSFVPSRSLSVSGWSHPHWPGAFLIEFGQRSGAISTVPPFGAPGDTSCTSKSHSATSSRLVTNCATSTRPSAFGPPLLGLSVVHAQYALIPTFIGKSARFKPSGPQPAAATVGLLELTALPTETNESSTPPAIVSAGLHVPTVVEYSPSDIRS